MPPALGAGLAAATEIAERKRMALYAVGGSVRDTLLAGDVVDLDLMTETEARFLAQPLAEKLGGTVKVYGRFGTTAVMFDGGRIDIATARGETYARPGALPNIHPAAVIEDLERRDFTINALALRLTGPQRGELLDPTRGLGDLHKRLVRVIHRDSFRDDASRTLRGLRYASRLNFRVEQQTRLLISEFAPFLKTVSASRLHTEVELLLADSRPWRSLEATAELGPLGALADGLSWDSARSHEGRRYTRRGREERVERLLVLLASTLSPTTCQTLIARLELGGTQRRLVEQAARFATESEATRGKGRVSRILWAQSFDSRVVETLARLTFGDDAPDLLAGSAVRPELGGDDLIALGYRTGPAIGRVLQQLLIARLNGEAGSRDDELALARKELDASQKTRQP